MQNSWNVIKKDLEDNLLCDSLKRRVRYVVKSDNKNIVYIKVDGIERKVETIKDKKIMLPDEQIINDEYGIYTPYILKAIKEYRGSNFNNSLYSHNPLVKMFAVMDKRATTKILNKLAENLNNQPEWLRFFYKLRFDAENISYFEEVDLEDDITEVVDNLETANA